MSAGRGRLWVDGRRAACIDGRDRGLQYGDGVFETMRVCGGTIRLLELHLQRLGQGLKRLGIQAPARIREELARAAAQAPESVLKLIITRGVGPRGYRPAGARHPVRVMCSEALPAALSRGATGPVRIRVCATTLGRNPSLAGLKTLNRLESVLARAEWSDERIFEGLMRDSDGNFVSGTMSNLFLRRGSQLLTPSLQHCGVAGVMRHWILRSAPALQLRVTQRLVNWKDFESAEEVFMSNAVIGVKSVRSCEWRAQRRIVRFTSFSTAQRLRLRLDRL